MRRKFGMVAVGTLIAERPPHRSRRALLTHRALPSDGGVEAVARHWVSYADRREEAVGDANKTVPVETRGLASSPQRLQPAPAHLVPEPPEAFIVARHREVVQVPIEHLPYPCAGLNDLLVHALAQLDLDRLQGSQHPLLDRLAPDNERAPFA